MLRGERDALRGVAGADRPDTLREDVRRQLPDQVIGAANLERSDRLQRFELQIQLGERAVGVGEIDADERCSDRRVVHVFRGFPNGRQRNGPMEIGARQVETIVVVAATCRQLARRPVRTSTGTMPALTRPLAALLLTLAWLSVASRAAAQDPPPKIGPFVVDLHGTIPRFPDDAQLAQSRDLVQAEMPGAGLGLHASANVYVFTWKAVTFGLGGDARVRASPSRGGPDFGHRDRPCRHRTFHAHCARSLVQLRHRRWLELLEWRNRQVDVVDRARRRRSRCLPTASGSRRSTTAAARAGLPSRIWRSASTFASTRFIPGTPDGPRPGSPRTTLLIIGAGVSVK